VSNAESTPYHTSPRTASSCLPLQTSPRPTCRLIVNQPLLRDVANPMPHRINSTTENTRALPRSRATVNVWSTMQKHTTTRSRLSTKMPNVCARRPRTGWSNTTRHIETATMLQQLLRFLARTTRLPQNHRPVLRRHHALQSRRRLAQIRTGPDERPPLWHRLHQHRQSYDCQHLLHPRMMMTAPTIRARPSSRHKSRL